MAKEALKVQKYELTPTQNQSQRSNKASGGATISQMYIKIQSDTEIQ